MTKSDIHNYYGRFSEIIELLRYTPNIHTLNIFCSRYHHSDFVLIEENENFQLVSKTNNIKKIMITSERVLEMTKFVVMLCSRLEHLTIHKFVGFITPFLQFLLSKDNNKTRYLPSLYIEQLCQSQKRAVKTFIESEKLHNIRFIKIERYLYLWR